MKIKTKITTPESFDDKFRSSYLFKLTAKRDSIRKIDNNGWGSTGEKQVLIHAYDAKSKPAALEVQKFDLIRPRVEQNPTACVFQVKNTGGKIGRILGIISIERETGQEVGYLSIGSQETPEFILPGNIREFRFTIPTLDKGRFKLIASLDMNKRGNEVLHKEKSFLAVGISKEE
jgi:hypothetical protein